MVSPIGRDICIIFVVVINAGVEGMGIVFHDFMRETWAAQAT